jgi:hypothetical protein
VRICGGKILSNTLNLDKQSTAIAVQSLLLRFNLQA